MSLVISMNSRSTIQRQPAAINTDVANAVTTPTSASFSFSTSVGGTPISPPFSQVSFDKLSVGRDADELPELEG